MTGRRGVPVFVAAVLLVTSGCASGAPDPIPSVNGFTGPYGVEFQEAYKGAPSDEERHVLEDGIVTTQEYDAARQAVQACMADAGMYVTYDDDGGFAAGRRDEKYPDGSFEQINAQVERCEAAHDRSIRFLYELVRRNPERLDDRKIEYDCLVEHDLIADDYTKEKFDADFDEGVSPPDPTGLVRQCHLDPLGLIAGTE
ncbi:hypothetical protein ACPEEZ_04715 [Frigoribacterium sp. 2-23]|uniref:hypothetical protein n=1 Tax=Frigoribacterium sp. 2-23 TaxID=3415006 RepID=UPI003C6FC7EF